MVLMVFGRDSSIRSLVDSLASKIRTSFDLISLDLPRVTPCFPLLLALQGIDSKSHWHFQFIASILDGFFEKFLVHRVNEINSS